MPPALLGWYSLEEAPFPSGSSLFSKESLRRSLLESIVSASKIMFVGGHHIYMNLCVCMCVCNNLEFCFVSFICPPPVRALGSSPQDTRILGHQITRTVGHQDTRTLGQWDTGTPGQ